MIIVVTVHTIVNKYIRYISAYIYMIINDNVIVDEG